MTESTDDVRISPLAVIGMAAFFGFIGYQIYLNYWVYTDDNPTRHDVRILDDAEDGDAHAQYLIGSFLTTGRQGMPADPVAALRWFRLAAEQGHPGAEYRLGDLYRRGDGVPRDLERALALFEKAAGGGSHAAEVALGDLYHLGEGVEPDLEAALGWYRRAAEADYVPAQRSLGLVALESDPPDHTTALRWLRDAANEGDAPAQYQLGTMYEHGLGVVADPLRAWSCYFSALLGKHEPARDRLRTVEASLSREQLREARSLWCAEAPDPAQ